ncbi:MAG: DNA mismatch repair endonuclease MutL [Saprospiraceae bacterium]|nr:DNA mismatch repair endonuclease MutL [Saprospiraceae bacterium]
MSDVIQLLPDSIANQIAAGEVVQRPASVVKELIENSIDAGAKKITVIIKDAGKLLVRVIDDGSGMSETDARMSLERHATSKIRSAEDLFKITTMGFRGEAMASIAAVSQMEVITREKDKELGTRIDLEASKVKSQQPDSCPEGTSISVKNLFYNIPARRNFLKSTGVEMRHIVDDFQRLALARPEIAFSLFQNDLETFNLPPGKLSQRIVHIFGKNYQEQLAVVQEETPHLSIHGYIGKPETAKKTRGEQFLFVNKRFIKSSYLNHAVTGAYEGLISQEYFPFYVLFLEIDPAHIDVNVHPTKTEIKFEDERTIYGVVKSSVRQALGAHNISPSLDFDLNVNFGRKNPTSFDNISDKNYSQFRGPSFKKPENENWESIYEGVMKAPDDPIKEDEEVKLTFPSAVNLSDLKEGSQEEKQLQSASRTFQLHSKYIITQIKSGMMMVDISRAHERILYERFIANMELGSGLSQQALFPSTLNLNASDYALLQDISEEVKALGFDFEDFGNNSIVIQGIPADLTSSANEIALIEGLIEQYKQNSAQLSLPKKEMVSRALAKRSCLNVGAKLSSEEMNALIDNLFACRNPNYTPDGQLTFFILDLKKIEQFFS